MPRRKFVVRAADPSQLTRRVEAIEAELDVRPNFAPEVLAAADEAAAHPSLPDNDCTDIPFVTIDPAGSMDLDQAIHIARTGSGYRVSYAIADLAAFVKPGGPIDAEAHRRGQTLYAPDHRVPLHPPALSEGAASLLPDQPRPALLWTVDIDESGRSVRADVRRAIVRSRAKLDYASCQARVDAGSADDVIVLLKEVGELRLALERERGGVSLPVPDQEVVVDSRGWSLEYRAQLPIEQWNAQISLLTGMAGAEIMIAGRVGIVRTLPPATNSALRWLRRTAAALHIRWEPDQDYPSFVRSLDPTTATGAAMAEACTGLFRGASYVAFDRRVPAHIEHAALATRYAHVTAPLRRLVDRYAGEIAVALCAGHEIPEWVRAEFDKLPDVMEQTDTLAHRFEREIVDLVEAGVLSESVGAQFDGVITDLDDKSPRRGRVMVREPAVEANVKSARALELGSEVRVTLKTADLDARKVVFDCP